MGYFVEVAERCKTRYLHLNKILVTKEGAVYTREVLLRYPVTADVHRSHLHYRLVINNNPVNSLAFRAAAHDNKLEQHAFAHAGGLNDTD